MTSGNGYGAVSRGEPCVRPDGSGYSSSRQDGRSYEKMTANNRNSVDDERERIWGR